MMSGSEDDDDPKSNGAFPGNLFLYFIFQIYKNNFQIESSNSGDGGKSGGDGNNFPISFFHFH